MSLPETRPSLLMRLRGGEDREAWYEFSEIYRPVIVRVFARAESNRCDDPPLGRAVVAVGLLLSGVITATLVNWPRLNFRSATQATSYSPPSSLSSAQPPSAAPLSLWDDQRPAKLIDQSQQILDQMSNP